MQQAAKKLLEAAMQLPEDEREELAQHLAVSVNGGFASKEIEEAWIAECDRRMKEIDDGRAVLEKWQDVKNEILEDLRASRR
jgi:putative addiction module component (TIGR02574 family)